MSTERFLRAVDEVTAAAEDARDALARAVSVLQEARPLAVDEGVHAFVERLMTGGGHEVRLTAADALRAYERAVAMMRAEAVRTLVDDDGKTFSEVAAMLGVTRQTVARLHQFAAEDPEGRAN